MPSGAGSYAVVAALTNANYAASNATGTLVINKAAATIALSNLTQGYDGLPKPATATTSPEGLSGVSITYNGSATAPTNLGSYAVVASLANPNYVASNATGTLVISKGTAAITLSNLTQTYDGSPNPVTATTSPEGLSGVSITYNGSATAPTSVGSYAVVASLANPNYVAPTATGTLVIMKVNQTITFAQPADISKALTTFTLSATATSGLAVTYTSLTTTVCTVSGSKVSLKLGGYCTIRASQAGTANYNPAPIVDRTFLIWNPTANVSGTGTFTSTSPAGTANFTVSAKYLTGATVPSGTTTFSVGTLSFSSTSYERLYGSGTTGLYWGTGTLNGVAGYSFRVTAVDGGRSTDRFRIKIWHDVSGMTVIDYDNQPGTPDDATLTVSSTLLTGGSLTIKN
ncbi:MAG: hypothetical protein DMG13_25805 [Acidobacteria bacterium]|nr:MAG: hypothetical protein DMG13_25805 [Acidobacteriota bacterium]